MVISHNIGCVVQLNNIREFSRSRSSYLGFHPNDLLLHRAPKIPEDKKINMADPRRRPRVAEILAHPSYPDTVWNLTPTQSGQLPVAAERGGPINIDWEVHGKGVTKMVWIMGLGTVKSSWQRQTKRFGHDEGDKYSSLIYDNRGMGKSEKPFMRYSTSEMAKDLIELLDHLGWTEERQLHVSGVSMGGMIAQELAYLVPARIACLNLISTAAAIENTTTFMENMSTRIRMFIPKTLDQSVSDGAKMLFKDSWLDSPDDTIVPDSSTPGVVLPPSGKYGMFSTNYERFAAQELTKRLDLESFTRKGFVMQAIAAGWHNKSPEQLKEIGDKVGRERIMVLHGTRDNMISVPHGRKLIEYLEPGTSEIKEGSGHVFMLEEWEWHDSMIIGMVEKTKKLSKN
ncbi:related to alpha/beta hydrolase [Rhynchosporium graminicola]|uniref:Related to alpha/beta hydrolase n=1 Tax=Rhynchosporium graminicola TaxID=2792576 RepID=A0A1E1L5R7_9HELO|nr:related to alpha/beta hydrolase [Rhynchosporium commune]